MAVELLLRSKIIGSESQHYSPTDNFLERTINCSFATPKSLSAYELCVSYFPGLPHGDEGLEEFFYAVLAGPCELAGDSFRIRLNR